MEPVPNNSAFSSDFTFDSPQDWFFDLDCLDEELPFPSSPINYEFWGPQDYSFDQYGAGPSNITSPAPPPRRSVKSTKFPSDEELTFLRKYAQVAEDFNFKRLNLDVVKMPPQRLQFKNLDDLPQGVSLNEHMAKVFDIFIRKTIQKAGGNLTSTKYWLNLRNPGYRANDGFWIMHQTYAIADGHFLCNTIANHMQSNKNIKLDDAMTISMKIFERDKKAMTGRGKSMPKESLGSKILTKFGIKWGLIAGKGHCLPKALAVGIVWSDYKNEKDPVKKEKLHRRYISLTRIDISAEGRAKRQLEAAKKLLTEAGMDPECEEHSLDDFDKLAAHLSKYRIRLWSNEGDTIVPKDDKNINTDGDGFIGLFFADNHYEFFKPTIDDWGLRFCHKCSTLVNVKHSKKCKTRCQRCGNYNCRASRGPTSFYCDDCNIYFLDQKCFNAHKLPSSKGSLPHCKKYQKCNTCQKIHQRPEYSKKEHECHATHYCPVCSQFRTTKHECTHSLPTEPERRKALEKQKKWTMVIYDFECVVTDSVQDREDEILFPHKVNAVAYRLVCESCFGDSCQHCGPVQYISFENTESVVDAFIDVLSSDVRLKNAYIVAHNGGGYDHIFLLKAMTKRFSSTPDFISNGSTILNATVKVAPGNVLTFRDSLRFMPMRLADMPKAFGLAIADKGHFPYLFNTPENYNKVLPTLPPLEFYDPKFKSEKEKKKLEAWYEENYGQEFDFNKEIREYCINDVEILTASVCRYMKLCQEMFNGWSPFIQSCTLASFILFVLKHEHIKKGVVGYIPENGFVGRNNSEIALKYIRWLEHLDPDLKLVHALRGGEEKITVQGHDYYVDAYNTETREIFEVYGCMWHGCKFCYPAREAKCPKRIDVTMEELYETTMARKALLEQEGFTVSSIWECEIKSELKKNREMNKFFKNCRHAHNLIPRNAMYGGRTQPFQSIAEADDASTLEYYDYCSVYPWVNIMGAMYPEGQPIRITKDFESVFSAVLPYRGIVFCSALAPKDLATPVLPYRDEGKLVFPLCRTCVETKNTAKCCHDSVSDRYLTGVWCSDELQLALDKGYKILRYHEVWHWPDEKWFRGGFFASFMKPLLKQKHEASGWPRPDMTDEEKDAHIENIYLNDGVRIDGCKIALNPALRSLAKLFLNSTWGKFAQRPGKVEVKIIKTKDHIAIGNFFNEPGYEPKRFDEWDEDHVLVARKATNSAVKTGQMTNVVYGALTTSAARIRLYTALERIGSDRLIYCDTDSVIFRQDRGTDLLGDLKGESLGMMTNEIASGCELVKVITVASKVYGTLVRRTATGEEDYFVKAKGVTLNSETAKKVNFDALETMMREYITNRSVEPLIASQLRFKRGPGILDDITTIHQKKRLRPVTDKGFFSSEGRYEPFGFDDENTNLIDDYEY